MFHDRSQRGVVSSVNLAFQFILIMIRFVKSGCIRGYVRYRRKKLAVVAILVTGLFLLVNFESGSERISRQEQLSAVRITNAEDVQGKSNGNLDFDRRNLPFNFDDIKVAHVLDTARETTPKKMHACPKIIKKPRFREIVHGVLVYSLWFDDRKSQHFIRILLMSLKKRTPSVTCLFQNDLTQKTIAVEASFYEHNENYQRRFGGFIASCVVPKTLNSVPCSMNISVTLTAQPGESNAMVFPVGSIDQLSGGQESRIQKRYGICIPPVYGDVYVGKIIEFLELMQILGASHFTFYDLSISESVRNVLKYYEDLGLVSVFPWNLPSYIGKDDLHYFGQPLAIWDCLFRSMSHHDFVAFHDLDEFIVPLRHENITSLLEYIHEEQHCGHCFESVLFDTTSEGHSSRLITQSVFHRTSQVTPYWTKCIVDPRRIFEQGIHHISKPIEEFYLADKVNWNLARIFHYRKCQDPNALFQPRCSAFTVDKTMQRFGKKLSFNFKLRMNILTDRKSRK